MKTRETVVELDGLEIGLRFDFNAADRIHRDLGINMLAGGDALPPEDREKSLTPRQIIDMVYAFYAAFHDAREEEPPVSRRKFGSLDIMRLYAECLAVQAANMPESEGEEDAEEEDAGNPPVPDVAVA